MDWTQEFGPLRGGVGCKLAGLASRKPNISSLSMHGDPPLCSQPEGGWLAHQRGSHLSHPGLLQLSTRGPLGRGKGRRPGLGLGMVPGTWWSALAGTELLESSGVLFLQLPGLARLLQPLLVGSPEVPQVRSSLPSTYENVAGVTMSQKIPQCALEMCSPDLPSCTQAQPGEASGLDAPQDPPSLWF